MARLDIAQRDEENVVVQNLHVGIGLAGMIYVVCAVASSTAIKAPPTINRANPQPAPPGPAVGLSVCDLLPRILRDFSAAPELGN